MRQVSCGIQLDINAALRPGGEGQRHQAALCDHNCIAENGHYGCPAAFTLNRGVEASSLAPGKILLQGLEIAIQAVKIARDRFLNERFAPYCKEFNVPVDVSRAMSSRNMPVTATRASTLVKHVQCMVIDS